MILQTTADMTRSAAKAAVRAYVKGRALQDTEGFDEIWSTAVEVPGWMDPENAAVFYSVMAELRPRTVVEIGSFLGRSTVFLALALQHLGIDGGMVTAIDPHTGDRQQLERLGLNEMPTWDLFRLYCEAAGVDDRLDPVRKTSDEAAGAWTGEIDFLYVDGWHSYDAVVSDCRNWAARLSASGVVVFDDVGEYPEVRRAVEEVCPELGLTIYGDVLRQAWAGRRREAPAGLAAGLRMSRAKGLLVRSDQTTAPGGDRYVYSSRGGRRKD